jgi:MarR family transcriptional regulator for hemolysin
VDPYDFDQSVGVWLTLAHQAYQRAFSERIEPLGITYRQAQVMGWISMSAPMSQSELAQKMLIEPPTLVRLLDRMEAAKLLSRDPDPYDGRRHVLRLTPAAGPLWKKITEVARQIRSTAMVGIEPAEAEILKNLLRRIFVNLEGPAALQSVLPQRQEHQHV